jgi:nitrogenase molybdenum-cofactor synthesis protein NifE
MKYLAQLMTEKYGTPALRVSYFGIEDMAESLYGVARHFGNPEIMRRTQRLVREEINAIYPRILEYRRALAGKKAAIYVGGAFKAFSLVKALRLLGIKTALVGSQTGNRDDYRLLQELCDPGTIIVDDSNPLELAEFVRAKEVDLFIGGVKERPIAYKLGIGFCDHNHERKIALAGFVGMLNFAKEVYASVLSPVWQFTPRREKGLRRATDGMGAKMAVGAANAVLGKEGGPNESS